MPQSCARMVRWVNCKYETGGAKHHLPPRLTSYEPNSHCLDASLAAMVGVRPVSLEEEGVCSQQF